MSLHLQTQIKLDGVFSVIKKEEMWINFARGFSNNGILVSQNVAIYRNMYSLQRFGNPCLYNLFPFFLFITSY